MQIVQTSWNAHANFFMSRFPTSSMSSTGWVKQAEIPVLLENFYLLISRPRWALPPSSVRKRWPRKQKTECSSWLLDVEVIVREFLKCWVIISMQADFICFWGPLRNLDHWKLRQSIFPFVCLKLRLTRWGSPACAWQKEGSADWKLEQAESGLCFPGIKYTELRSFN